MDKQYSISDFARRISRSASTVRPWERSGLLKSKRLASGHRYFDEGDVRWILGKADRKRLTVVYCWVSSHGQKDDLQAQIT
ncbi:MerR family transcriptional regulator [Methylovirgula sp. HY1]|uniref:MerR family transcriptional regulator n=1 Tax=Methylovirgula sp. HY1 TaxID=2822761 RepID=UPI001C5A6803